MLGRASAATATSTLRVEAGSRRVRISTSPSRLSGNGTGSPGLNPTRPSTELARDLQREQRISAAGLVESDEGGARYIQADAIADESEQPRDSQRLEE